MVSDHHAAVKDAEAEAKKYVKPGDSMIRIETVHGVPPISMVWNPDMAKHLKIDKVRRWYIDGETRLWSKQELTEFTHLCCVAHHAPVVPGQGAHADYGNAIADFWVYMTNLNYRMDREELLHRRSLGFVQERAKKNRWILPGNLETKYNKQVAVLVGNAPPPKHKHHHHHHHKKEPDSPKKDPA